MDTYEKIIYSSLILASLLLGVLLCSAFLTIIVKQNKLLKKELNSITKEIRGVEDERKRIARNLHDDLGPILSLLRTSVNAFELSRKEDLKNRKILNSYFKYAIESVRTVSTGLMPSSLVVMGLVPAVQDFIELINHDEAMTFYFFPAGNIDVGQEKEIHIYRLIQETLWNTKKHSKASRVELRMRVEKNFLIIDLEDNGKEFDFDKSLKNSRGIGLAIISNRLKMLRGRMKITASESKGNKYIFEIPLNL